MSAPEWFFFSKIYVFLFQKQSYREKKTQKTYIHWFTPQITTARTENIQSQKPGASSVSLAQVQRPKGLECKQGAR